MKLFRKIRAKMLSNKKVFNYMLYAIGEIALIVIGILLALYLQNRNEENKIQETVNTTISLLRDEITTNKKNILNAIDYHTMVRDTLQKIEMPKTVDEINRALSFWRGMQTPKLQDAAFQTGIQSGVNGKLDPLVLIALNELYTHQESYNELNAASAQIFFNADFTDVKDIVRTMGSVQVFMRDLYYSEKKLNESFDYCLKQIDSIYK